MYDRRRLTVSRGALALLCTVVIAGAVHADGLAPYAAPMGAGDAWGVANANTGVALDSGLVGGVRNPAGFLTDRNEIMGEGSAWGAFAIRNRVSPTGLTYGAGSIGYLNSYDSGSLFVIYQPRTQVEEGAQYLGSEVVDKQNITEIGAGYALRGPKDLALGLYLGSLRGQSYFGILQHDTDQDTVHTPRLWLARAGIQKRSGNWRWGASLEGPPIGSIIVERPVNVGNKRQKQVYSYRGAWTARAGVGLDRGAGHGYEADITFANTGSALIGDDPVAAGSSLLSTGVSGRWRWNDQLRIATGLRYRFKDPRDRSLLLFGIGGEYAFTDQVLLYGGGGLMFPVGNSNRNTVLEDIRPWLIRGGILFHEKQ